MTTTVRAWGVKENRNHVEPVEIERRDLREDDLRVRIEFSGICHTDIHNAEADLAWLFVPGHEIIGIVEEVGPKVTRHKVGDRVGIGCFVDACDECDNCRIGETSYCDTGVVTTYNGLNKYHGETEHTRGGYSQQIIVREDFALKIPDSLDPAAAAPLLCAGITTYSPLKRWGAGPGKRVAFIGMGGLGHVGVKIAVAMGAEVSVFSQSDAKKEDAAKFGAKELIATRDGIPVDEYSNHFDLIINTVSAEIDIASYMELLRLDGTLVQLGLPSEPLSVGVRTFLQKRRSLAGSLVGGIPETQEMLDFCAEHGVVADVEVIGADYINEAYRRTVDSDVRYRFVIDGSTF